MGRNKAYQKARNQAERMNADELERALAGPLTEDQRAAYRDVLAAYMPEEPPAVVAPSSEELGYADDDQVSAGEDVA